MIRLISSDHSDKGFVKISNKLFETLLRSQTIVDHLELIDSHVIRTTDWEVGKLKAEIEIQIRDKLRTSKKIPFNGRETTNEQ
jgi:hypothetical protein